MVGHDYKGVMGLTPEIFYMYFLINYSYTPKNILFPEKNF